MTPARATSPAGRRAPEPPEPASGSRPGAGPPLATLAVAAPCFAGPPASEPARRVGLGGGAGWSRALAFAPDGELLTVTMLDYSIRLWRTAPGSERAWPLGPPVPGFVAALSPDCTTLAVGGLGAVALRDVATGHLRRDLPTDDGRTSALAFRRDGLALAAAGERAVTVWDPAPGREGTVTRLPVGGVRSLAFAPDGRSLATGGLDGQLRLWDLAAGRRRLAVPAHDRTVGALAFSDDGRSLALASSWDGVARLWDAATGARLAELRGHAESVQAVAFAPGGRVLATAGADLTVRLWEAGSGRERVALRCPVLGFGVLAFAPDGRWLALGGFDPEVRVWDVAALLGRPPAPTGRPG